MVIVGKTDEFEHRCMEKFRSFAAQFGHFVGYERDIATRDIGLHLTEPLQSGGAKLTTCFCWFQMKGIMADSLPHEEARAAETFKYRMKVEHLKFWFLQPSADLPRFVHRKPRPLLNPQSAEVHRKEMGAEYSVTRSKDS